MAKPWFDTWLYGSFAVMDFIFAAAVMSDRWMIILNAAFGGFMVGLVFAQWSRWAARRPVKP